MPGKWIRELINCAIEDAQTFGVSGPNKVRRYLGGSMVGRECTRDLWYAFHWALEVKFDARMLRLFERGHREEARFIEMLRMIGCEVQDTDPDTHPRLWWHPESDSYFTTMPTEPDPREKGSIDAAHCEEVTGTFHEWIMRDRGIAIPEPRQFSWVDVNGHHRGNTDGRARNLPAKVRDIIRVDSDEWVGLEFKTHNLKSFNNLVSEDEVRKAKAEHWHQTQRYMHHMKQRWTLYGAVNKNDDEIYWQFVPAVDIAGQHDMKVREAIYSHKPPRRISTSPSWMTCKYCDWRAVCHYGMPMQKNCRTCVNSIPVDDGQWHCAQWGRVIPKDFEAEGCGAWKQRTD